MIAHEKGLNFMRNPKLAHILVSFCVGYHRTGYCRVIIYTPL